MFQIGLYDSSAGSLYLDISARASNVVITTGEHGFGALTCFVRMSLAEAFQLYDRPGLPHVQVSEYGGVVWQGRLEDVAIVPGGVRLTALGYWRALSDSPYRALWSLTSVAPWVVSTDANNSRFVPALYSQDNNNRLYVALVKGNIYGSGGNADVAGWHYVIPSGSRLNLMTWAADYEVKLPTNWKADFFRVTAASDLDDGAFTGGVSLGSVTGDGTVKTGSIAYDFSANSMNAVDMRVYNNTGSNYTMAGESGSFYAKLTNLRLKTTASASVYADEIAADLLAFIGGLNGSQINTSAALVNSPAVDLTDEVFEDQSPSDILDHLACLGDNSSPVALYETGVWESQLLSFQKRGTTARTWYVDISALELERTIDALYNAGYATYQDANGRTLRTAGSTDADSIARYGLHRARAVPTQTTSAAQAQKHRDVFIQDGKDPRPRIGITFDRVFDGAGSLYPLWMVRAWDSCVLRNLPATLSASIDRIRQFRVISTTYHIDTDTLEVVPEAYLPTLDVLVARRAAGISR